MATIIMFHSVNGLRFGVLDAASKFTQEIGIPGPGTSTDPL